MSRANIEKERIRTEIYHRYVMGQSVSRISEEMGIDQPLISKAIAHTKRLNRKHVSGSHAKHASRRISELDAIIWESKAAWQRSQKDSVEKSTKQAADIDGETGDGLITEVTVKRKAQNGDPRFLTEWRQANRDGASIEGLLSTDSLLEEFSGERPLLLEIDDRAGAEPFLRQTEVRVVVGESNVAAED